MYVTAAAEVVVNLSCLQDAHSLKHPYIRVKMYS